VKGTVKECGRQKAGNPEENKMEDSALATQQL
jgi:hypothetical protein